MKLKNYLLLSAAILTTSSFAGNFYVGAGAAYVNSVSTVKLSASTGAYLGGAVIENTSSALSPRFFVGYEKDNNNCFMGGEIIGSVKDIHGGKGLGNVYGSNGVNENVLLTDASVRYSRNYTVGARVKFGGYITDELSSFAALGVVNSQFKITYSDNLPQSNSLKKRLFGIEPGVGVSYKLSRKWRVGAEYFYQQYESFRSKNLTNQAAYSVTLSPRFKFNTFLVSASYTLS